MFDERCTGPPVGEESAFGILSGGAPHPKGFDQIAGHEQLCLHVDMAAGKSSPASAEVWAKLKAVADAHANLPLPEGAGRAVGQRK